MFRDGKVLADGTPRKVLTDTKLLGSTGLTPPLAVRACYDLKAAGVTLPHLSADKRRACGGAVSIVVEHVSFTYSPGTVFETIALRDVSLTIEDWGVCRDHGADRLREIDPYSTVGGLSAAIFRTNPGRWQRY